MSTNVVKFPKNVRDTKPLKQPKTDISTIDNDVAKIQKQYSILIKKNKKRPELSDVNTLSYLLKLSLSLIPLAQEDYIRERKGIYAINALTSQVQELQNSMRMLSNGSKTADYLVDKIFTPTLKLILNHILNDFADLKAQYDKELNPKKAKVLKLMLNNKLKGHGQLLNDITESVRAQIENYLIG